jgi:hypothetical protein
MPCVYLPGPAPAVTVANMRNVKIDKLMLKDTCTANVRKEYLDSLRKEKIDKVMLKNAANVRTAELLYMRNKEKEIGKVMRTYTANVYEVRYGQCDKQGDWQGNA